MPILYNVIIIYIVLLHSICYNYIINERRLFMVKPWNNANCYGYAVDINRWFVFDDAYENAVDELIEKQQ